MMFAIGPCAIQVPFACLMLVQLLRNNSRYAHSLQISRSALFSVWIDISVNLNDIVYIVFVLKPTIDASSLLLFMGEYRQYSRSFVLHMKKLAVNVWNAKSFKTKVHHLTSGNTITVAPSALTRVHTIA